MPGLASCSAIHAGVSGMSGKPCRWRTELRDGIAADVLGGIRFGGLH